MTIDAYLTYLHSWPGDILPIIPTILTTLGNFLSDLQANPSPPSNSILFDIMTIISKIVDNYEVAGQDLIAIIVITDTIVGRFGAREGLKMVLETAIYSEMVDMLRERKERGLERNEVIEILRFIGRTLAVEEEAQIEVIRRHPMLYHLLSDILIDSLGDRSRNSQATHNQAVDCHILSQVLFCFANLASNRHSCAPLSGSKVFQCSEFLAGLDLPVKEELSVLIFNCVVTYDATQLELIL